MKIALISCLIIFPLLLLSMCTRPDAGQLLENYLWQNRLILVFAPKANDERFIEQNTLLDAASDDLKERDVIIWRFVYQESVQKGQSFMPFLSTDPFNREFEIGPRDFAVILIGKDGNEKFRASAVTAPEDLFDLIDSMPMRQKEIQAR